LLLRQPPLQRIRNHGVSDGPPKTLSSRFQPFLLMLTAEPLQGPPRSPEQSAGARGPPAAAELHSSPPKQGENSSPESFYWHPCRASASPLTARERAMHEIRGWRCFIETFPAHNQPVTAHADRAFSTRHPPEHRHDSQAVR